MNDTIAFLIRHGYGLVFLAVLTEQAGLPIPSPPLLLAAGALGGTHRMNLFVVIGLSILAVEICDILWYLLGRRQGMKVLQFLCRISLQPDSCVRQTQVRFERSGAFALVVAKFVPGLNAMAPPLAGITRMPWRRFLLFDGLGGLLWSGSYVGAGYLFSEELLRVVLRFAFLGRSVVQLLLAALALYIGWKFLNRWLFLRKLRIARITSEELKQKLDAHEEIVVVDLRHAFELHADPEIISGAVHMDPSDLEEAYEVIPRDRDIVVYCNCPNEATSAEMALHLRKMGITRIRPLAGGLTGWRSLGFPLESWKEPVANDEISEAKP